MTLEEKYNEYKRRVNYKLDKNLPLICIVDGRGFSKRIKKKFKRPFDDFFIYLMNTTAELTSKEIQCCKFAYVQSDEISFYIDSRNEINQPFFEYRICKLNSLISSTVTGFFNTLMIENKLPINEQDTPKNIKKSISSFLRKYKPYQFDCKSFNVDNNNDVYGWFLHRQLDCIRNSKQQAAQTYIPHNDLLNLNTDEQIELLRTRNGIDWNNYEDGKKFGRFIWKEEKKYHSEEYGEYLRSVWISHDGWELNTEEGRKTFEKQLNL
jgi:tRNA(His) 5'-end guanylyltransferase